MTTIRHTLHDATRQIRPVSDSASLDAQLLLAEVLGKDRAYLLAHGDDIISADQLAQFAAVVQRRAAGEPIAYILGRRAFYDRELLVAPGVLIPRPETELLLEAALEFTADKPDCTAADIGTGSGALAVTFAAHRPQAHVYAVDISPAALDIARKNAAQQQVHVTFLDGDLLQPLIERGIQVDVLMANLPYIARDALPNLAVSQYEPSLALDGGPDGLDLVRRLLRDLRQVCEPGALALLEIGADQGEAALSLAHTLVQPRQAAILKDYAGHDRILRVEC
ncbi:MAG: protein-(glutamine-N5) methyltransferase, release factor-specific [Anaerolineaceae bacterium]|nr:protein-(glutamine-N5) methyltransferase, release factor-specific [Anaerolineaceae bacterium]